MEGSPKMEGREMKTSIAQMLEWYLRELLEHSHDAGYSARNLAGTAARIVGKTQDGPETERAKNQVLGAFYAELARKVRLRDRNPGIDQDDITEEVVRDAGIPEREVPAFAYEVAALLRRADPPIRPAIPRKQHERRFTSDEYGALRNARQRRDAQLPTEDDAA
jgi:hypothetical protein